LYFIDAQKNFSPKAAIIELNRADRKAAFLTELKLASIPTKEDKIVLNIEGIGYVFDVVEVHYVDNEMVDVNVI
jgi:hypothetical protein